MNKEIQKFIVIWILYIIFSYNLFSFIFWEWDISNWGAWTRLCFAGGVVISLKIIINKF